MGNYLPSTAQERSSMLASMGYGSVDELYAGIPAQTVIDELAIPEGKSEFETRRIIEGLAAKNTVFHSVFRGAGAYDHYRPSLVKSVLANETFITSYTPYQAEISQGVLQSIFEYQSLVCELTGLDVSNASLYDGASAAAEAILMCLERKRTRAVVAGSAHPQFIETIQTYAASRGVAVDVVPTTNGAVDPTALQAALSDDAACVFFQQPNYFGVLEDARGIIEAAHTAGAKAIMGVEPTTLGLLAAPGELGADICIAEGQALGLPLSFGGPYLGIIACTSALMRKLPGRIVGQTVDAAGNRAFVLTLQAREQHIRREKASSNVCSNEALCALGAAAYLSAMGPVGLEQVARQSYAKAQYAARKICAVPGFDLVYDRPFFNEFVTTCPIAGEALEHALTEHGILAGLPLNEGILWCVTETNTKEDIDRLAALLAEVTR
ncbi:MAG: aminomethyl-transferring glycine dehydrogenase subunit GcvPA [Gordonibacter sp.]|uniref:aminomethyl-transferring glycine dehydrogenase subunit GcvPA n=1 Tax=Gordonibacter sp. TaxID=1968902 RepID=UPI002FC8968C